MDDKYINKLIKKSLSGQELLNNSGPDCKVMTYPELVKYNSLSELFGNKTCIYLLYTSKLNYGHWVLLIKRKNGYEHFNSYSAKPDDELKYIPEYFRIHNNMIFPHLSYLYYKSKKPIHYSDIRLQKMKKGINTCGRFVLLRYYFKEMDVDDFNKLFDRIKDNDRFITYLTHEV